MFVLNEDEYREFKRYKSSLHHPTSSDKEASSNLAGGAKCPICAREYPNENIMAHHLKSHVNGLKCNICGKVFKLQKNLNAHLRRHPLQVQMTNHSVLDNDMPNQPSAVAAAAAAKKKSVAPKKQHHHKHKSLLNFEVKQWLSL
jgi:hypothetical protein